MLADGTPNQPNGQGQGGQSGVDYSDFCIVSIYYRLLPTELNTTKTFISPELLFVPPDTTGGWGEPGSLQYHP